MTQSGGIWILLVATFASFANATDYKVLPTGNSAGIVPQEFAHDVEFVHEHGNELFHKTYFGIKEVQPQYDFHVSIERGDEVVCSGAIVNGGRHVITAASCDVKDTDFVRIQASNALKGGNILGITCVKNHPNFQHGAHHFDYDIAVIRLNETTYQTSLFVNRPRQIPRAAQTTSYSMYSKSVFKNSLIVTDVPINSNAACEQYGFEMSSTMLCAGQFSTDTSFCNLGRGSPLFDHGVLIGIKSSDVWCSRIILPAIYTNVGEVHDWIINTITSPTC